MKTVVTSLFTFAILFSSNLSAKEFHVSVNGNDSNDGSAAKPFKTINAAVKFAFPGDIITVHAGTYREWVNPIRGGESDSERIVYRAAPGEKVEIKGSEIMSGWRKVKNTVWKVTIPNSFFKDYNPYRDSIFGDWFDRQGRIHHTGEVFLNNKSLYEKENTEKVFNPPAEKNKKDPKGATYTWYCESKTDSTTIWANFQEFDPNRELVEISTRRTCFYPDKPGINYITISGFYISQAATQWAAPTAEQIGMISTHWNKGWIIENNVISNSKCSGITLGKERGTGHNVWSANMSFDGSIHYIEVVFRTLRNGWNKENIGSHIVRNNEIFSCEQTGMCGSMGAAFSLIENNHIYNIHVKNQFTGAEIGGIKFHAAIDAIIRNNRIHDNEGFGCWFDWMTQGTRISKNLMYNNAWMDLFFEVNHGPFLVDNNLLLSAVSIGSQSEGGAYVHNLITGQVNTWPEPNRYTPYHLPHSTEVAGLSTIMAGDDRYYNNIFVGRISKAKDNKVNYGMNTYNLLIPKDEKSRGSNFRAIWPVWINGNVYYNKAVVFWDEKNFVSKVDFNPDISLVEEGSNVYLQFKLDDAFYNIQNNQLITTELLGKSKMAQENYENNDGTPLQINTDFFGNKRSTLNPTAGPFENPAKGLVKLKVW